MTGPGSMLYPSSYLMCSLWAQLFRLGEFGCSRPSVRLIFLLVNSLLRSASKLFEQSVMLNFSSIICGKIAIFQFRQVFLAFRPLEESLPIPCLMYVWGKIMSKLIWLSLTMKILQQGYILSNWTFFRALKHNTAEKGPPLSPPPSTPSLIHHSHWESYSTETGPIAQLTHAN